MNFKVNDRVQVTTTFKDKKGKGIPSIINGIIIQENNNEYIIETTFGRVSVLKTNLEKETTQNDNTK